MKLGFLFRGDTFKLLSDGAIYQAGSTDAEGYVSCINLMTNEEKKIYVDEDVEFAKQHIELFFKMRLKQYAKSSIEYAKAVVSNKVDAPLEVVTACQKFLDAMDEEDSNEKSN